MASTPTTFPGFSLSVEALRTECEVAFENMPARRSGESISNSANHRSGQQLAHPQEYLRNALNSAHTPGSPQSIPVDADVRCGPSAAVVQASEAGPLPQGDFDSRIAQAGASYGNSNIADQAQLIQGNISRSSRTSLHLSAHIININLGVDYDIGQRRLMHSSAASRSSSEPTTAASRPIDDILHAEGPQQQLIEGDANKVTQSHPAIVSEHCHEGRETANSSEHAENLILPASEAPRFCKLRGVHALGSRLLGFDSPPTWPCCRWWKMRKALSIARGADSLSLNNFEVLNPDGTRRGPFLRCLLDTGCSARALIRRSKAVKLGWTPGASPSGASCRIKTTKGDILRVLGSIRLHVRCRRTRILVDTPFLVVHDEDLQVAEGVLGNGAVGRKHLDCTAPWCLKRYILSLP